MNNNDTLFRDLGYAAIGYIVGKWIAEFVQSFINRRKAQS